MRFSLRSTIRTKNGMLSHMRKALLTVGIIIISVFLYGAANGALKALDPDKDAIITGSTRDFFVSEVIAGCSKNLSQAGGYSVGQINEYCSCTGTGAADITTLREAENFKSGGALSADYRVKFELIANNCKKTIL